MDTEHSNLHDDLGMFEAAVKGEKVEIHQPAITNVLAVLDGSNQDDTAKSLAKELAELVGAKHAIKSLPDATEEAIVELTQKHQASLLVIPVPFGRDIEKLKDESLGSVVDMVLQNLEPPVLCVRQLMDADARATALKNILVPILDLERGQEIAAGWAMSLLRTEGNLELFGVADEDVLKEARQMLGDAIDPTALKAQVLDRAVTRDIGPLVSALQQETKQRNINMHVEVETGHPIPLAVSKANAEPCLTIIYTPHVHTDAAHHHAVDMVLGATGPVLVV